MSLQLAEINYGNLVVLAIFAFPLIRAAIESARKSREAQQAPPRPKGARSQPARGGGAGAGGRTIAEGKPMTWEDLLSGRGPQAPAPKEPPPLPKPRPALAPDPEVEFEDVFHEHEGPMVPRSVLGRAPSEDELERHGGDRGRPLTEDLPAAGLGERLEGSLAGLGPGLSQGLPAGLPTGLASGLPSGLSQGGLAETHLDRPQDLSAARARAGRRDQGAGGWRRALVQAELLAGPIALRDVRAPGPFAAPPGLGGR